MDPMMKMYMFHHWLEDINDDVELFKHHGYLVGSFINPEAVKQMTSGDTYSTTDEEFEQTWQTVVEANKKIKESLKNAKVKRKRRKKVV